MTMTLESAFSMDTSSIKYGPGVTREIGWDMEEQGARRVMVVTDPNLTESDAVAVTLEALRDNGIDAVLFDQARVEPTDVSFKEAIKFAEDGKFDGFVAVGGGSSMDTAKAANLYSTHPADFMTYVNPPIGKGVPIPGPLKPLVAVPTTAGTGSETTGVAIFDLVEMNAKTGIAHRALRPEKASSIPTTPPRCPGWWRPAPGWIN
jgi:hydroxyacid-oxoacid transhydrogenase